jgi:hypothetical protein
MKKAKSKSSVPTPLVVKFAFPVKSLALVQPSKYLLAGMLNGEVATIEPENLKIIDKFQVTYQTR